VPGSGEGSLSVSWWDTGQERDDVKKAAANLRWLKGFEVSCETLLSGSRGIEARCYSLEEISKETTSGLRTGGCFGGGRHVGIGREKTKAMGASRASRPAIILVQGSTLGALPGIEKIR
jgi:hypothetical protein